MERLSKTDVAKQGGTGGEQKEGILQKFDVMSEIGNNLTSSSFYCVET